jgi:hypothetical protein
MREAQQTPSRKEAEYSKQKPSSLLRFSLGDRQKSAFSGKIPI